MWLFLYIQDVYTRSASSSIAIGVHRSDSNACALGWVEFIRVMRLPFFFSLGMGGFHQRKSFCTKKFTFQISNTELYNRVPCLNRTSQYLSNKPNNMRTVQFSINWDMIQCVLCVYLIFFFINRKVRRFPYNSIHPNVHDSDTPVRSGPLCSCQIWNTDRKSLILHFYFSLQPFCRFVCSI